MIPHVLPHAIIDFGVAVQSVWISSIVVAPSALPTQLRNAAEAVLPHRPRCGRRGVGGE